MADPIILSLPPGVVNKASKIKQTANWRETNLIRWDEGELVPVGGWSNANFGGFASRLRCIHGWKGNDGVDYTAFLCETNLYVYYGNTNTFYDISPVIPIVGPTTGVAGYGENNYGFSTYGTPRPGVSKAHLPSPVYTLDNWGEELRAMASPDGRLLKWAPASGLPSGGNVSGAVPGAPVSNRTFVITPERYIILFGAGGVPQKYQWCDREDDTNWTPGLVSDAGDKSVEPASPIISAKRVKNVTLFFSLTSAYTLTWIGRPNIFSEDRLGSSAVPIAPNAIVEIPQGGMWQAESGMWLFNGVSIEPMRCDVHDWISKNINRPSSRQYATVIHNSRFSELWFSFVSNKTSGNVIPDKTAVYDYKQDIWFMLDIGRLCGFVSTHDDSPLMSDGTKVYKHEDGSFVYADYTGGPWGETHVMNVLSGSRFIEITQLMPDVQGDYSSFSFQMVSTRKPTETNEDQETYSPARHIQGNGLVDIFRMGRDVRMRFDASGADWSFGDWRLFAKARGNWTPR